MKLAITGANGYLGRRLLRHLAPGPVRALVRSASAAEQVHALHAGAEVRVVDFKDPAAVAAALSGCDCVVHLVGIIKERPGNDYHTAHEATSRALAEAAVRAGTSRIVYLSILGAHPHAANACLASRGRAEALLLEGAVPTVVIRVPMVLGEQDHAARALAARARRSVNVVLRAESLEQPIFAGDVVAALLAACARDEVGAVFDLAGAESLPRSALIQRAAQALGRRTRVISVPLALGLAAAWLLEQLSGRPPVTRAMLGVLDHDDRIDPGPAARALGLRLTGLDATLEVCLAGTPASS